MKIKANKGMEYIREHYNVPAKRGVRVTVYDHSGLNPRQGTITGVSGGGWYIRIRLDGQRLGYPYHPTDTRIRYGVEK